MPLPAPYAPPWQRLGEDGVALLAWLGLKVRELWRRNGEGGLPVPPFWPRRGRRLFWPLVLAGVLSLALALGRAWLARPAAGPLAGPGGLADQTAARPEASPEPLAQENPPTAMPAPAGDSAPVRDRSAGPAPSPLQTPESSALEELSDAPALEEAAEVPAAETFETPADMEANRLRAQWSADDSDQLIAALSPDPAALTLTLQLNASFLALPAAQRQRWAERWQQRANASGYSHLRLCDGQRRLLGRDALVGGGMLLLEPPGAGTEAP